MTTFIESILESDRQAPRKQRHTAHRIWQRLRDALAAAQQVSHANSIASAQFFSMIVNIYRREAHLVQDGAEQLLGFSNEHGLGAWMAARSEPSPKVRQL
jgi:hypothetical protein